MSYRSLLRAAGRLLPVAFVLLAQPLHAADVKVGDPWVRGTVKGQMATGAFMTITASEAAALVSATSPVAGVVEIHSMKMEDGVMKMRAIPRLDLPAGTPVALDPGGYHVMLMDLKQPLKTGEMVPITLKLEGKDKAVTTLEVKAEVRPLNAAAPAMEHKH
ncbi:MAG: copper chaperone PCu(A)C [Sterolibacteriaceae bacterium]|uniref:Copper chaperone PCu(A)C n=1 Tax=Candidatus Methylophosphatis roskildensis TaxID=2899263 RepID=A0A9D7E6F1_9PROT|nr:copper chaperone PCu(A)C [Candidatus Methylophosphatis roskildensis]MBK7235044.1 copper chaperone PCu(A)C [Sterolibacteriaceae bacterium]